MERRVTAKELRNKVSSVLREVRRGKEVFISYRGKEIAVLKPIEEKVIKEFNAVGFGMWKERQDLKDVEEWLAEKRKPRYSG